MQTKQRKRKLKKKYDELLLASKGKEKEIKTLENIKQLLLNNKQQIEGLNQYFVGEYLSQIQTAIIGCINAEAAAKAEGIENFKTDKIQGIGTPEWKNFIVAAEEFAKNQKTANSVYPGNKDNCLLCHQPLSVDAQNLISNYWVFIKSVAEQNARTAVAQLDKVKAGFEQLNFDLFPAENYLTVWLIEKNPQFLSSILQNLSNQKILATNIISDIVSKTANERTEIKINVTEHNNIVLAIDASIKLFRDDEQCVELERLLKAKTKLAHKEKLELHFVNIETNITNQQWIHKTYAINWGTLKQTITNTEKRLSGKYFNQKYIDTFNQECKDLNGEFEIFIDSKSSGAKSNRQLLIKGNSPSTILSEGEQKVIAAADFLSEMQLSEINRGIIFDDPVNSLDNDRKKQIAERFIKESTKKQVIIFTHDLVFVSMLIPFCEENKSPYVCHWIEKRNSISGYVFLNNSPSYEKEYKNAEIPKKHYTDAKKDDCPPAQREFLVHTGFTALRTCYEVLVINDLFNNVVQRFNERVSVERLKDVYFDDAIINELRDNFSQCCRYMEGHSHSDKFAYKKPDPENLNEEIQRYEALRTKIKKYKKN